MPYNNGYVVRPISPSGLHGQAYWLRTGQLICACFLRLHIGSLSMASLNLQNTGIMSIAIHIRRQTAALFPVSTLPDLTQECFGVSRE